MAKQLHERRAARAAGSGAEWLAGKQDEREFASEEESRVLLGDCCFIRAQNNLPFMEPVQGLPRIEKKCT